MGQAYDFFWISTKTKPNQKKADPGYDISKPVLLWSFVLRLFFVQMVFVFLYGFWLEFDFWYL